MRLRAIAAILFCLLATLPASSDPSTPIAITHVTILDVRDGSTKAAAEADFQQVLAATVSEVEKKTLMRFVTERELTLVLATSRALGRRALVLLNGRLIGEWQSSGTNGVWKWVSKYHPPPKQVAMPFLQLT